MRRFCPRCLIDFFLPMKLGVVVTCHPAYLRFLPEALAGWEAQAELLDERVLVLDGVGAEAAEALRAGWPGWRVIEGMWGNPNPARNAGWLACAVDWVIGWDADNVPPAGYAAAARRAAGRAGTGVGALAPAYVDGVTGRALNHAVTCGGDARDAFVCDTSSVWRREAVLQVGGWVDDQEGYDDWTLAKLLQAQGWQLCPLLGVQVRCSDHAMGRRSKSKPVADCLWRARSVGVVSLQAGRISLVERWLAALAVQEMPRHWGLTLMLPEGREGLRRKFEDAVRGMMAEVARPAERVTFLRPGRAALRTPVGEAVEAGFYDTHRVVGALYGQAVAATPEDLILTWEDDVFPHQTTGLRQLSAALHPASRTAAVAGVYPSRGNPRHAVAAVEVGEWSGVPTVAAATARPVAVPMGNVGFGFTLWQRLALERCPILAGSRSHRLHRLGLDGDLCRRLHGDGWKLKLHGGVTCDHVTQPGS
jgi:hypothetical protein